MESTLQLTPEEAQVFDFIKEHGKVTQLDIVRGCPNLGSHPRHENYDSTQSTLRKIRAIIRSLRINRGLFILSDVNGYWILRDRSEIDIFLKRKEQEAKASAKAFMVTYHAMRRNFGVSSNYFDKQIDLFGNEI